MRLALPYGLAAELIEGEPPAPTEPTKPRLPRRWAKNGHLWETCGCHQCAARRLGLTGADYGTYQR